MKMLITRALLAFLVAAVAISPAKLLGAEAPAKADSAAERLVDAKAALSAMTALAEHPIQDMASALAVAAQSQEVQSLDWAKMKPLLAAIQEHFVPATVWFAQPDGTYYSVDKGRVDKKLTDRPYFAKVLGGETSIGELVVSRSTGGDTVIVAVPIKAEGKVAGMLGASIYLDKLAEQLKEAMPLPEGVVFFALDTKGQIALHTVEERIFKEATQLGGPSLGDAVHKMLTTQDGEVTYEFEGAQQKAIYKTSKLTGWKFAIRTPAKQ